jgi:hypothetical protein
MRFGFCHVRSAAVRAPSGPPTAIELGKREKRMWRYPNRLDQMWRELGERIARYVQPRLLPGGGLALPQSGQLVAEIGAAIEHGSAVSGADE